MAIFGHPPGRSKSAGLLKWAHNWGSFSSPLTQPAAKASLLTGNPQASFPRMVELAAEQSITLTVKEVKGFLKQMDEEDEFDDIELDTVALLANATINLQALAF